MSNETQSNPLVKAQISGVLKRTKPPPKIVSKDVFKAVLALNKDSSLLVVP